MNNFQSNTYTNTGYRVERTDVQMIVLDSKSVSAAARANDFLHKNVYYKLVEPLYVDSPTDIFFVFSMLS